MPGQRPVVCRHWPGSFCASRLLAWCLRRFRGALTDGGRSCRARSPAFGARPRVLAVPAQVRAGAAAIGHHLVSGQADAAHPAGFGVGLSCPVRDRAQLASHSLLSWETAATRCGPGARSGDVHWRGGSSGRLVLRPGCRVSQLIIWPVAGLGCARLIWPTCLHMHALPVRERALVYPGAYARRRACPPLYRGRAHPSVSFSDPTIPEPALQPDKFPVNVQPIYPLLWRVMWTTSVFLLCTGREWCSRS
jgi:hypothetical protein